MQSFSGEHNRLDGENNSFVRERKFLLGQATFLQENAKVLEGTQQFHKLTKSFSGNTIVLQENAMFLEGMQQFCEKTQSFFEECNSFASLSFLEFS